MQISKTSAALVLTEKINRNRVLKPYQIRFLLSGQMSVLRLPGSYAAHCAKMVLTVGSTHSIVPE